MYYIVANKEINEYLNEYLLTKKYKLYKLNHEVLDRIYYYYDENIYLLISKNIYNLPNIRKYYYWFENKSVLSCFIERLKQTTIKKYKQNYFNLYKDFEKKLNDFKIYNKQFEKTNNKAIDELRSLTFTYYELNKFTNLFKHKYENLDRLDSSIFENKELNINTFKSEVINCPEPQECILNFKQ